MKIKLILLLLNLKYFMWYKIIAERTFNNNVDKIQHGNMYINRKLQPVAVKVLHPGIKKQLRYDIFIT